MKKKTIIILCAALAVLAGAVLAAVLAGGDSGGGGRARASGMWLVGAEGSVAVTDGDGGDVPVRARPGAELRLSLHSGYRVGTERESFGWLDLDDEKLAKLDELSAVQINKSGRKLEIEIREGSLYFNVKKPLRDDETMEIRSSTMVMAIRGTSGWVTSVDGETFDVYIIEGKVRCTAGDEEETVRAGEHARLTLRDDEGSITVEDFTREDIPEFVLAEAREDEDLREELSDIGIDVEPGGSGGPDNPGGPDDPEGPDGPDGGSDPLEGLPEGEFVERGSVGDVSWEVTRIPEVTGRYADVYFYLVTFEGPDAGIPVINDFFAEMARDFVSETANLASDRRNPQSYTHKYSATVWFPASGLVDVRMEFSESDPSAVHPWASATNYVMDLMTGQELTLLDAVGGTEGEVRQAIKDALTAADFAGYITSSGWEHVDSMEMGLLDFSVADGKVTVSFSATTLGFGTGMMTESVDLPLSARYGGEGLGSGAGAGETASGTGWSISGGTLFITPEIEFLNETDWTNAPWKAYPDLIQSLEVAPGVTAIGNRAFYNLYYLREVTLPAGLLSIGVNAFAYCKDLESIEFPESLRSLGNAAFSNSGLTAVTVPASVTEMGEQVFKGCEELVSADIQAPVEELRYTFQDCSALVSVTLPRGLKTLWGTFLQCESLRSVELPDTLTEVGFSAFNGAGLETVTLPEGVTTLGEHAFKNCAALRTVTYAGSEAQWASVEIADDALPEGVRVHYVG